MPVCDMTGAYERRVAMIEARIQDGQPISFQEVLFYLEHLGRSIGQPDLRLRAEQALLAYIGHSAVRTLFEHVTHIDEVLRLGKEINRKGVE